MTSYQSSPAPVPKEENVGRFAGSKAKHLGIISFQGLGQPEGGSSRFPSGFFFAPNEPRYATKVLSSFFFTVSKITTEEWLKKPLNAFAESNNCIYLNL